MMKDFTGKELNLNDTVAVVYHPRAYHFSLENGIVTAMDARSVTVTIQTADGEAKPKYMLDEDGTVHRVAIIPGATEITETDSVDAVNHPVHVGDKVAFQRAIEAGNTCKGFEYVGTVTKITKSFIFAKSEDGTERRKGFNGAIIIE